MRLLRAVQAELARHENVREERYRCFDPDRTWRQPAGRKDRWVRSGGSWPDGAGGSRFPSAANWVASRDWPPRPQRPATAIAKASPCPRPATYLLPCSSGHDHAMLARTGWPGSTTSGVFRTGQDPLGGQLRPWQPGFSRAGLARLSTRNSLQVLCDVDGRP